MKKLIIRAVGSVVLTTLLSLPAFASTGIVNTDALNVRTAPSTSAGIMGVAYKGDNLDVLNDSDSKWATVQFNDKTAYVAKQYIDIEGQATVHTESGIVNATTLNIRQEPSTSAQVVGQAPYGATLTIYDRPNAQWAKVTYNGIEGYVSSQYLGTRRDGKILSRSGTRPISSNSSVIDYAKKFLGVPYSYGGNGPSSFDCSGFVKYVYANFGVSLSRTTYTQVNEGVAVDKANLQAGDLVFFGSANNVTHVGIYISDGNFIHASKPGDFVKINSLNSSYYVTNYYTARRVR